LTAPRGLPDNASDVSRTISGILGGIAEVKMALEDDLKARASALVSQQMANWVVEIQRAIQGQRGDDGIQPAAVRHLVDVIAGLDRNTQHQKQCADQKTRI